MRQDRNQSWIVNYSLVLLPQRGTIGGECDAARCRVGPEMHPVGAAA